MTDTQWADFSEFQVVVNDLYPYRVVSFRANDGTYRDGHFTANMVWAKSALARGQVDIVMVYAVYEPDNEAWAETLMAMIGAPFPELCLMLDVESWGGRIFGDHSADLNAGYAKLAKWLNRAGKGVLGYGNVSDLNNLWRSKPTGCRLVVAAYGFNPPYPGKIAHQYADNASVPPFGRADINSADGLSVADLAAALGIVIGSPVNVPPVHPVVPPPVGHNASSWSTVQIQQALNKVDNAGLAPDGVYGPATTAAVRAFEIKYHLTVDIGIAGPQVVAKLAALIKVNPVTNLPHLVIDGKEGPLTTEAEQRALHVTADGIRGPVTIKAEQNRTGATEDGFDGPDTNRHLQAYLNKRIKANLVVDGIRGPLTVRALQRALDAGEF